jgi:hypothetical protein
VAGASVTFAMPRGKQLTAQEHYGNLKIRLAETPMLIQQSPRSLNQK